MGYFGICLDSQFLTYVEYAADCSPSSSFKLPGIIEILMQELVGTIYKKCLFLISNLN